MTDQELNDFVADVQIGQVHTQALAADTSRVIKEVSHGSGAMASNHRDLTQEFVYKSLVAKPSNLVEDPSLASYQLFRRFQVLQAMDGDDQEEAIQVIDAMMTQQRMISVLASVDA
jgi:hypothetical protein